MHRFDNGLSMATRANNWGQIRLFCLKRGTPLPDADVEGTMGMKPGAAAALLTTLYETLTLRKLPPLPEPAFFEAELEEAADLEAVAASAVFAIAGTGRGSTAGGGTRGQEGGVGPGTPASGTRRDDSAAAEKARERESRRSARRSAREAHRKRSASRTEAALRRQANDAPASSALAGRTAPIASTAPRGVATSVAFGTIKMAHLSAGEGPRGTGRGAAR